MASCLKGFVILITISQLIIGSSCRKNGTSCNSTQAAYSFRVTSEWSPQKVVYSIGDTITLFSSFPKTLQNFLGTSSLIDFSNSTGIGGSYAFYELDSSQNKVKGAVMKLEFIPLVGDVRPGIIVPDDQKSISYQELPNAYQFKLKIVLRSKGIYAFFISDLLSRGINGKNCTEAGFTNIVSNTDKNLSLFQYAMNRPPASQYEVDRIYCFRVQ